MGVGVEVVEFDCVEICFGVFFDLGYYYGGDVFLLWCGRCVEEGFVWLVWVEYGFVVVL